jgi:hypothetical protein
LVAAVVAVHPDPLARLNGAVSTGWIITLSVLAVGVVCGIVVEADDVPEAIGRGLAVVFLPAAFGGTLSGGFVAISGDDPLGLCCPVLRRLGALVFAVPRCCHARSITVEGGSVMWDRPGSWSSSSRAACSSSAACLLVPVLGLARDTTTSPAPEVPAAQLERERPWADRRQPSMCQERFEPHAKTTLIIETR